ncbi:MAG: cupin domain-containing protein [Pseudomonadota bacterium]
MTRRYTMHRPGDGANYDWENDHTFVKVGAADTGGAYTLMEDNLKATFALGLHRHDTHAETFYFLEGAVDFYVDGDWHRCTAGTTIHVPPGVPHACKVADDAPAKMLMIYQPSGFDEFLAEMAQMTAEDFADNAKMSALNEKYDIVPMGPVPEHADDKS